MVSYNLKSWCNWPWFKVGHVPTWQDGRASCCGQVETAQWSPGGLELPAIRNVYLVKWEQTYFFLHNVDKWPCKHLDSKHFYLEMVDLLWSAGCSDVLWLCGHTNVNSDLKVVLLLANKNLVGCRVVEAFICVHIVGRWRPGKDNNHSCWECDIRWSVQHFGREKELTTCIIKTNDSSGYFTHCVW